MPEPQTSFHNSNSHSHTSCALCDVHVRNVALLRLSFPPTCRIRQGFQNGSDLRMDLLSRSWEGFSRGVMRSHAITTIVYSQLGSSIVAGGTMDAT
jgi:hypothetical protein